MHAREGGDESNFSTAWWYAHPRAWQSAGASPAAAADSLRAAASHECESPQELARAAAFAELAGVHAREGAAAPAQHAGAWLEATLARMSIGARKPTMRRFIDGAEAAGVLASESADEDQLALAAARQRALRATRR